MTGWHLGVMLAFDLETTGVSVETDRIVTACLAHINGSTGETKTRTWLVNPGIEIPDQAAQVHGITTERVQTEGMDPREAVAEIAADLAEALEQGIPVVGFNIGAYDLTLLDRELRRYDWPHLVQMLPNGVAPVIDARVLDKQVDRYRKGGRKLTEVCAHYGVVLGGAHDATEDAVAAARVAWKIAAKYPEIARLSLQELHAAQVRWKREQDTDFAAYRRRRGQEVDGLDGSFPVRPFEGQAVLA